MDGKNKNRVKNTKIEKSFHASGLTSRSGSQEGQRTAVVQAWSPPTFTAFKLLLSARLCSAIWSHISDCDETFNYWEPLHFLLHGKGFQTWEYSPDYAIRSYAYLWIHVLPLKLYSSVIYIPKILQFFILKFFLAFACTLCELYFYKSILSAYGANLARLTLTFLLLSCGMFISSSSFLPSSFTMYTTMLAFAGWFNKDYPVAIFGVAAGTILGWPFVAVLGVPIAYDLLVRRGHLWFFTQWSVICGLLCLVPCVWIDSYYFGGIVIAPLNIVIYNIFTEHGPDLYGTEPATYYFINGILNFNVAFLLALVSLPLAVLFQFLLKRQIRGLPMWLPLSALYIWMLIFFTRPHKEERFLYPVYPLICFAAAAALDYIQKFVAALLPVSVKGGDYVRPTFWLSVCVGVVYGVLCASRGMALYQGYHAPMDVYQKFTEIAQDPDIHTMPPEKDVNICVGKEWYRFPSNFFLPGNNWHLHFIQSDFKGLLPKPYDEDAEFATRARPSHMNDMNREEPTRYISITKCHYLVDLDLPQESDLEPRYSKDTQHWSVVASYRFLDAARSHRFFRAFYIPWISEEYCSYADYNILKTTRTKRSRLP